MSFAPKSIKATEFSEKSVRSGRKMKDDEILAWLKTAKVGHYELEHDDPDCPTYGGKSTSCKVYSALHTRLRIAEKTGRIKHSNNNSLLLELT